jgi:hypothetical protein
MSAIGVLHNYEKYDATLTELSTQIESIKNLHFTGALTMRISNYEWKFLLRMGKLGWASGGSRAVAIWEKYLHQYSPQFPLERITVIANVAQPQLAANHLTQALVEGLIYREYLTKLTVDISREMRLDIKLCTQQNNNLLYYKISPDPTNTQLNLILPLVELDAEF